jgi:HEAT repeat protein
VVNTQIAEGIAMIARTKVYVMYVLLVACAALCRGNEKLSRAAIPSGLEPALRSLIDETFSSDVKERAQAAVQLGKMGEKAAPAVPFLIRLLPDETLFSKKKGDRVSFVARKALQQIGSPAVEPLLVALRKSSDEDRFDMLSALGGIADHRVTREMLQLLDDKDEEIREEAAEILVSLLKGHSRSREVSNVTRSLIHALSNENETVRSRVTTALGYTHDGEAFEPLVTMLRDPDRSVRGAAARALAELGDTRAKKVLKQYMGRILKNEEKSLWEYEEEGAEAAMALGKLGRQDKERPIDDESPFEFLLRRVRHVVKLPTTARRGAIRGLGELRDQRALKPLQTILANKSDEPPTVREAAAEAIASIKGREAAPLLRQYAMDKTDAEAMRAAAARSLADVTNGEIDDVSIVELIANNNGEGGGELALRRIAKRGKVEAVRSAARQALDHPEE